MNIMTPRLAVLRTSLQRALDREWPHLANTQRALAKLETVPISRKAEPSPGRLPVVATVASDGGENRLNLEPLQIQVIRVADSLGAIHFEEFLAQYAT